ncbi:MAG: hypothetical protein CSB44_00845 [Gammaproteobacteria bacterium]|nr:MAG: hypothetical protein CSB44_00845 [Gammaproteobacteria bacterium]
MNTLLLALVVGFAFGFVLDRIGATNPNWIIDMLRLSNLHLMRTILLAIGIASVLLFGGLLAGLVNPSHLSVKGAYIGVILGGALLGAGWAMTGYCPGTGLSAAASGRVDAFFFVLGGLFGAAAYMASYAWVKSTGILDSIAGGKSTLGAISEADYTALFTGVPGEWIGIALGIAFIAVAFLLPASLRSTQTIDDTGRSEQLAQGSH